MGRILGVMAVILAGLILLPSAGVRGGEELTVGTGSEHGLYFPIAKLLAKEIAAESGGRITLKPLPSGGSAENIDNLLAGKTALAFAQSDKQYQAVQGRAEWNRKPQERLRFLFSLYPETVCLLADEESGIRIVENLRGKRVAIGNEGSGQRNNAIQVLKAIGLDWEKDIIASAAPVDEAVNLLLEGKLDALFYTVGQPNALFATATAPSGGRKVRFIPIHGLGIDLLVDALPFYNYYHIPVKRLYPGCANEIDLLRTIGVITTVLATEDMSEDTAYALVKIVFENIEDLRAAHPALADLEATEMMNNGQSAPYHPGALRYFREAGLLKP